MALQAEVKLSPNRLLLDGVDMFFAVLPDEDARAEMIRTGERFVRSHRLSGSLVDIERLHLKLAPIGRPDRLREPPEGALLAAAEAVRARAFRITLDCAMRFSTPRRDGRFPFVLCSDKPTTDTAFNLRRALADAQYGQGLLVPGVSSYLPHVTLLYGQGLEVVEQPIPPLSWLAREFVLIRRFFGQSRHEVMGRWPLDQSDSSE